ncbi:MAG: hypothetical protein CBB71_16595 [Rhodopirellula sp. TMED11]|nr:MAG: hypothetical protein CBB71_16595 [Rhodopirellula sp. TMED11]
MASSSRAKRTEQKEFINALTLSVQPAIDKASSAEAQLANQSETADSQSGDRWGLSPSHWRPDHAAGN